MSEQDRARAMQQLATRAIPDRFDRWPAIRKQALALRSAATGRAPRRGPRWLTRALGPTLVALALVVALLVMVSLAPGGNAGTRHILQRAGQAVQPANPKRVPSYHLTATQTFAPGAELPPGAAGATTMTIERWRADDGRLREQNQFLDANGAVLLTQGGARNATDEWLFYAYDGKTDALHWSANGATDATPAAADTPMNAEAKATRAANTTPDVAQATAMAGGAATKLALAASAPTPAAGTSDTSADAALKATAAAAGQTASPPADPTDTSSTTPLWSLADTTNVADLSDLLATLSQTGCDTAARQADDTVVGRLVYVIKVVSSGACPKFGDAGTQLTVRVDQETFLTLGWEQRDATGALVSSYTTTSIEYGVTLPDSMFQYTPPPDAYVCAADGSADYPTCQTKGPQRLPATTP